MFVTLVNLGALVVSVLGLVSVLYGFFALGGVIARPNR
jgi:hypothetical protein